MLGHEKLNLPQLETALCEVEASVNDRPLTYLSEDPEDLVPLTPAMFLQGLGQSQCPELSVLNGEEYRHKFRVLNKLHEELRGRFRREYLSQLILRGRNKQSELQVGDVVLIGMDNRKRRLAYGTSD